MLEKDLTPLKAGRFEGFLNNLDLESPGPSESN